MATVVEGPRYFSVFADPQSSSSRTGNPAVLVNVDTLESTQSLISMANRHPGCDVCFFLVSQDKVMVRWFNGSHEIQFCGHATLALAWWLTHNNRQVESIQSINDSIRVVTEASRVWIQVPMLVPQPALPAELHLADLAIDSVASWFEPTTKSLLLECRSSEQVASWKPEFECLNAWSTDWIGALILFSRSHPGYDACLRYFSPWYGKNEDSATGSALRLLVPLLEAPSGGDSALVLAQLSAQGGVPTAKPDEANHLLISGVVVPY